MKKIFLSLTLKNIVFLLFTNFFDFFCLFLINIYVARVLGPVGTGAFTVALAFPFLFSSLVPFGLDLLLVREVAIDKESKNKLLGNAFIIITAFGVCVVAIINILAPVLGYSSSTQLYVFWGSIYFIEMAFSLLFRSVIYAYEKMQYETIEIFIERALLLLGGIFIILKDIFGIENLLMLFCLSKLVGIFYYLIVHQKITGSKIRIKFDYQVTRSLIKRATPFSLNVFFSTIYTQFDLVLLSFFLGEASVGLYRAAVGIINPISIMAVSINNAFYPVLSGLVDQPLKAIKIEIKQLGLIAFIALPVASMTFIFADFITILFSKDFSQSVGILRILAFIIPFRFMNNALATIITSLGFQRKRMKIIGIGSVSSVLLNLILIPFFSFYGAGITVLLTEIILFILLLSTYLKLRASYFRFDQVIDKVLHKVGSIASMKAYK